MLLTHRKTSNKDKFVNKFVLSITKWPAGIITLESVERIASEWGGRARERAGIPTAQPTQSEARRGERATMERRTVDEFELSDLDQVDDLLVRPSR